MNSPTLNGETEAHSPVTVRKTIGSAAALDLGSKNDEHTEGSIDFRTTSVSGEFASSEIVRLQSACCMSLQRRKLCPSSLSASSTKQHRCTVYKVNKSTGIESKGVADVSVVDLGMLPCIVVCMADDTSSSSTSRDHASPVCIALFDGSSCSYSRKWNCVRFDIAFYKSLEKNRKFIEIMSVIDASLGLFRLYIDLGSPPENEQFTSDFLQRSRPTLPVLSLSWWSSKRVAETIALYDCLARAFNVTGKCSLLPNKEKLVDSTASPSEDCYNSGRLSRCVQFTFSLLFSFLTLSTL